MPPANKHPAGVFVVAKIKFVVIDRVELGAPFFVQDDVVEPDPVTLRIDVELARCESLVAIVSKRLRQRGNVRHPQRFVEVPIAVGPTRGSCHQGASGRDADGAFAVGASEPDTVPRELIERGSLDRGMSGDTEQRSRPVVRADHQNVWMVFRH
jgi:hypothetical protein